MDDRDPRAVLGLPPDATRDDAQRAFRRLAKVTHPDAGGDAARFRVVAGAWEALIAVLPAEPETPANRVPAAARRAQPSPHVRAYRQPASRVVWAEFRPPAAPSRTGGRPGPDFGTILKAEVARLAS